MKPGDKPSWMNAPSWAGWLAQDEDGQWDWYECEPYAEIRWWAKTVSAGNRRVANGRVHDHFNPDWREAKFRRPTPQEVMERGAADFAARLSAWGG